MIRLGAGAVLTIATAWLWLYLSSTALLVGESIETGTLKCTYFSGTRTFVAEYNFSPTGFMGRAGCERLRSL